MFRLLLILFLFLVFTFPTFGQALHWDYENFTSKNGLAHNTIISVFKQSNGIIWACTMDGFSRIDANGIRNFRNQEFPEIPSNFIHSILETAEDTLWILTRDKGFTRFIPSQNEFKAIIPPEGIQENGTYSFIKTATVLSSNQILIRFSNSNWALADRNGNSIPLTISKSLENDENIRVLKLPQESTFLLNNGKKVFLATLDFQKNKIETRLINSPINPIKSSDFIIDTFIYNDELFVGLSESGILKTSFKEIWKSEITWENVAKWDSKNFSASRITGTAPTLFISNQTAAFIELDLRTGTQKIIQLKESQTQNAQAISYFNSILRDDFGNTWLGSWGSGLFKLKSPSQFLSIPPFVDANKSYKRFNLGILEDHFRTVWLLSEPRLIRYYPKTDKQEAFSNSNSPTAMSFSSAWQIRESDLGIWMATNDNGVNILPTAHYNSSSVKNEVLKFTTQNSSLASNRIAVTLKDSFGRLWISHHDAGIQVFKSEKDFLVDQPKPIAEFKLESKQEHFRLPDISARFLFQEKNGSIWGGTFKAGLIRLSDPKGELFVFRPDSSQGLTYSHFDMRAVYEAPDSSFWIASYGGGIIHWDRNNKRTTFYSTNDGLSNNFTYGFINQDDKFLWITTNNGLDKLDLKTKSIKIYTDSDGLLNNEFNTGGIHKGKSGNFYVGGVEGVNYFNPNTFQVERIRPNTIITSVKAYNKELIVPEFFKNKRQVSFDDHFLTFSFTSNDLTEPTKNRYKYRLLGADTTWIDSENRTTTSYSNLAPGEYTFEALATNRNRIWGENPAQFAFEIIPPFWMQWWFRLTVFFTILGLFTWFIRYISTQKLKQLLLKLESEQKMQNERERISRDLHDHVGNQLANILSGIDLMKKYAEHNQVERAKEWHSVIKDDVRYTMQQLRETIWTLSRSEITLSNFAGRLETYFRTRATDELHIITEFEKQTQNKSIHLSPGVSLNVFRIVQEAVQNSIKYAITDSIKVRISVENNWVTLSVKDNGVFINRDLNYDGYGIKNMHIRANEIGGTLEIIKLESGTEVILKFPTA